MAAHPGVANTNIFNPVGVGSLERTIRGWAGHAIGALLNSDEEGALPTLYAATAPRPESGGYYGPQGFMETRGGDVGPAKVTSSARDKAAAERLWTACQDLTGIRVL